MHDPRIGRFGSIDKLASKYPWNSPYSFSANRVMDRNELEGLETGPTSSTILLHAEASGISVVRSSEILTSRLKSAEQVHMMLDALGFIPVGGELADGLNATLYTFEGDYLNAGFSMISLAPLAGDAGAKGLKYSLKYANNAEGIAKGAGRTFKSLNAATKWISNATKFGVKSADAIANRIKLKGVLKIVEEGIQAHHIIPVEALTKSEVVQKAVDAGFDFNGKVNGIGVKALKEGGTHANHPSYTKQVLTNIEEWSTANPNYTGKQAKEFLDNLAGDLKELIQKESVEGTKKVNDLKF